VRQSELWGEKPEKTQHFFWQTSIELSATPPQKDPLRKSMGTMSIRSQTWIYAYILLGV